MTWQQMGKASLSSLKYTEFLPLENTHSSVPMWMAPV